jgi:hypothetical protein
MIVDFPHKAPENCYYEYEEFKHNVVRIWLCNTHEFDYNLGAHTKTVWGFYHSKRKKYYAPINAKTVGKEVNINNTTAYTAIIPKLTGLEKFFC